MPSTKTLLAGLSDLDAGVRRDAARAIGALGLAAGYHAEGKLALAVDRDSDLGVRLECAAALGRIPSAKRVSGIIARHIDDQHIGYACISTLVQLGVFEPLEKALSDGLPDDVRLYLARTIVATQGARRTLGGQRIVKLLAADFTSAVREAAAGSVLADGKKPETLSGEGAEEGNIPERLIDNQGCGLGTSA